MKINLFNKGMSFLGQKGMLNFLSDEKYLELIFKIHMGERLNLKNPKTFNEKLQWLKIYDRKKMYTQLVDKYGVREYIRKSIGAEYLIPILGVYKNFDEINFEKLPNKFVLKCTHDSGGIVICLDKKKLDMKKTRKIIEKHLKKNYFYMWREWPYKNVEPRIICEKYMEDNGEDIKDYKFMCFNGKVKCLFVCTNRKRESLNIDFYDIDWKHMPFERKYKNSTEEINKPQNFDKMIELAEILAEKMKFVRIDFYEIKGKVYFGEITFYPGSGIEAFEPKKYDEILGEWIKLY